MPDFMFIQNSNSKASESRLRTEFNTALFPSLNTKFSCGVKSLDTKIDLKSSYPTKLETTFSNKLDFSLGSTKLQSKVSSTTALQTKLSSTTALQTKVSTTTALQTKVSTTAALSSSHLTSVPKCHIVPKQSVLIGLPSSSHVKESVLSTLKRPLVLTPAPINSASKFGKVVNPAGEVFRVIYEPESQEWKFDSASSWISIKEDLVSEKKGLHGNVPSLTQPDCIKNKIILINEIAMALVKSFNLKSSTTTDFKQLKNYCDKVVEFDGEFILKLCVYTRTVLNLRTPANWLMAYAATKEDCKKFISTYYPNAISLPNDWMEVCEIFQEFLEYHRSRSYVPKCLKKSMIDKFESYKEYSLAKYNKEKSRLKKVKFGRKMANINDKGDRNKRNCPKVERAPPPSENCGRAFTIKRLIRLLHIKKPVDNVMKILGKKYPATSNEFYRMNLGGSFDPELANKRMKLKTPETWETQVSILGNKASVWENLIDKKNLPYMATLRNIRNLITAGISQKHHTKVLNYLSNEGAVILSKQMPFRFLSAFKILDELKPGAKTGEVKEGESKSLNESEDKKPTRRTFAKVLKFGKKSRKVRTDKPKPEYSLLTVTSYRKCLQTALLHSTCHNLDPIPGRTLILINRTVGDMVLPFITMLNASSENCEVVFCDLESYKFSKDKYFYPRSQVLENIKQIEKDIDKSERKFVRQSNSFSLSHFGRYNTYVLVSDKLQDKDAEHFSALAVNYLTFHDDKSLFVSISSSLELKNSSANLPFLSLVGSSESQLRLIAERSNTARLKLIDNVHLSLNKDVVTLKPFKNKQINATLLKNVGAKEFKFFKVFISSTFLDMSGERTAILRRVIPRVQNEIMKRDLPIQVVPIDLRWGVPSSSSGSLSLTQCLREVDNCDVFIGCLGNRYGSKPSIDILRSILPHDFENFENLSVTALEILLAMHKRGALIPTKYAKGLELLVNNSDIVPSCYFTQQCQPSGEQQRCGSAEVVSLRNLVDKAGFDIHRYVCATGSQNNDEIQADQSSLDDFVSILTISLLGDIAKKFTDSFRTKPMKNDQTSEERVVHSDVKDEADYQENSNVISHLPAQVELINKISLNFHGRNKLIRNLISEINDMDPRGGLLLVHGAEGIGKTFALGELAKRLWKSMSNPYITRIRPILFYFPQAVADTMNANFEMLKYFTMTIFEFLGKNSSLVEDIYWDNRCIKSVSNAFYLMMHRLSICSSNDSPCITFIIDNIDHFMGSDSDCLASWLPDRIPKNVLFVLSCNTKLSKEKLMKMGGGYEQAFSSHPIRTFEVPVLDPTDKPVVIENVFKVHGKQLDKSNFSKQISTLTTKRDCKIPLYLTLATQELQLKEVRFDTVLDEIKLLPPSLPALCNDILTRLQNQFGADIVGAIFSSLICVRPKSMPLWLLKLVVSHMSKPDADFQVLTDASYHQIVHFVKIFLQTRYDGHTPDMSLSLKDDFIFKVISQKYGNVSQSFKAELLVCLSKILHWLGTLSFTDKDVNGILCENAKTHVVGAMLSVTILVENKNLISKTFLTRAIWQYGAIDDLILLCNCMAKYEFFQAQTDNFCLVTDIKHCLQQTEDCGDDKLKDIFRILIKDGNICCAAMLQDLFFKNDGPEYPSLLSLKTRTDAANAGTFVHKAMSAVRCLDSNSLFAQNDGKDTATMKIASAGDDCAISIFVKVESAWKFDQFLIGHMAPVVCLKFLSSSTLLSGAKDYGLSLWNCDLGMRILRLAGFRRSVSNIQISPDLKCVAASSFDAQIMCFGVDGLLSENLYRNAYENRVESDSDKLAHTPISKLRDNASVNCVAWNSDSVRLVAGNWRGQVKIWDVYAAKRLGVWHSPSDNSIKAICYSPCEEFVITGHIDASVVIWEASRGLRLCTYLLPGFGNLIDFFVTQDDMLVGIGENGFLYKSKYFLGASETHTPFESLIEWMSKKNGFDMQVVLACSVKSDNLMACLFDTNSGQYQLALAYTAQSRVQFASSNHLIKGLPTFMYVRKGRVYIGHHKGFNVYDLKFPETGKTSTSTSSSIQIFSKYEKSFVADAFPTCFVGGFSNSDQKAQLDVFGTTDGSIVSLKKGGDVHSVTQSPYNSPVIYLWGNTFPLYAIHRDGYCSKIASETKIDTKPICEMSAPLSLAAILDGKFLCVVPERKSALQVLDLHTGECQKTIPLSSQPSCFSVQAPFRGKYPGIVFCGDHNGNILTIDTAKDIAVSSKIKVSSSAITSIHAELITGPPIDWNDLGDWDAGKMKFKLTVCSRDGKCHFIDTSQRMARDEQSANAFNAICSLDDNSFVAANDIGEIVVRQTVSNDHPMRPSSTGTSCIDDEKSAVDQPEIIYQVRARDLNTPYYLIKGCRRHVLFDENLDEVNVELGLDANPDSHSRDQHEEYSLRRPFKKFDHPLNLDKFQVVVGRFSNPTVSIFPGKMVQVELGDKVLITSTLSKIDDPIRLVYVSDLIASRNIHKSFTDKCIRAAFRYQTDDDDDIILMSWVGSNTFTIYCSGRDEFYHHDAGFQVFAFMKGTSPNEVVVSDRFYRLHRLKLKFHVNARIVNLDDFQ